MDKTGIITEYEKILTGEIKSFSLFYSSSDKVLEENVGILLRYVFETMNWSPQDAQMFISRDFIERFQLDKILQRVTFPPELNPETDLIYFVKIAYPDEIKISKRDYVLKRYQERLDKKVSKFPKDFFVGESGLLNFKICLNSQINKNLSFYTLEELYEFFSGKKGIHFLKKIKLKEAFDEVCADQTLIDILRDIICMEDNEENLFYYHFYKFQSEYSEMKTLVKSTEASLKSAFLALYQVYNFETFYSLSIEEESSFMDFGLYLLQTTLTWKKKQQKSFCETLKSKEQIILAQSIHKIYSSLSFFEKKKKVTFFTQVEKYKDWMQKLRQPTTFFSTRDFFLWSFSLVEKANEIFKDPDDSFSILDRIQIVICISYRIFEEAKNI